MSQDRSHRKEDTIDPPQFHTSQFISGYPQNTLERQQSRAAIKSNASRHRWRKRVEKQRRVAASTGTSDGNGENSSSSLELAYRRTPNTWVPTDPVLPFRIPNIGEVEAFDFSRSLHTLALPPVFPVDGGDLVPVERLGKVLQDIRDVHEQVFPMDTPGKSLGANTWMEKIIQSGAVFYSHAFGQMMREAASDPVSSAKIRHVALTFHQKAVKIIKDNMSQPSTACNDENILAVFALSQHQISTNHAAAYKTPRNAPKQGPLRSLRLLDLYGGPIRAAKMHQEGLSRMVELRGGVQNLELAGLKEQMCYAEVLFASRQIQRPQCDFFSFFDLDFRASLTSNRRVDHPIRSIGTGFEVLGSWDTDDWQAHLRIALDNLALYSLGVDDYVAGRSSKRTLSVIGEQRLFVQHSLLSLIKMHQSAASRLARICHFAGMIYSFLCVFPIPEASFEYLVTQIKDLLQGSDFHEEWIEAPHLLVWVLCMTGIASIATSERTWVVASLDRCLRRLEIGTWQQLKAVLQKFLWLPITNDKDGETLWREVEASSPLSGLA